MPAPDDAARLRIDDGLALRARSAVIVGSITPEPRPFRFIAVTREI